MVERKVLRKSRALNILNLRGNLKEGKKIKI